MSKVGSRKLASWLLVAAAAGLLLAGLKLPVWRLKMEAPQYQGDEALRVQVYPGSMKGDLREIRVLNKYIGVHIPERLPQLSWLPFAICVGAGLGLLGAALPRNARRAVLLASAVALSAAMLTAAAQAQHQMREIGHHRDPHAPLKGVGDFTAPLLGSVNIANFHITSNLGAGAFLIATAIALQAGAGLLSGASQASALINTSLQRGDKPREGAANRFNGLVGTVARLEQPSPRPH